MDWPILSKEVDFVSGNLPTYETGLFSLENVDIFRFLEDGITLVPNILSGVVHVPFSVSLCNALLRASVQYDIPTDSSAAIAYRILYNSLYWTWNGSAWVSSSDSTTWGDISVIRNIPSWVPVTDFQLDIKLSRTIATDDPPTLKWFGLLYTVMVPQWDAYIQGYLSNYISTERFVSRVGIAATTHLSGSNNVLTIGTDVVFEGSYLSPEVVAVLYNGQDILSSVAGQDIVLTQALDSNEITVLYEYSLTPMIINQSLDLVQIETFPVIVVSNISYKTDSPGAYRLELKDEDAGNALTCQWPVVNVLSFTLTALATLYWDSLGLWSQFSGYEALVIELPEVGKSMLLEVTDRVREASFPGGTSGTKVFDNGFKLTYPSPIPKLKTEMLVTTGMSLSTSRLGG
jgi:hypothetical protein